MSETFKYLLTSIYVLREQLKPKLECVLCGTKMQPETELSICGKCIECADCCVGLEKLED